jgi:extracellular matrix protein 14
MRNCHVSSLLIVLLLICACVLAVPPAPPGRLPSLTPQPIPSWRRFSNQVIAKFWGQCKEESHTNGKSKGAKSTSDNGSRRAWARYGQDIVLRFNVTTTADAVAITEASRDLYLDVWEFNDNWVDIRLAKNDVCLPSHCDQLLALLTQHRSLYCLVSFQNRYRMRTRH